MDFDKAAAKLGRFSHALRSVDTVIKHSVTDIIVKLGYPVILCGMSRNHFLCGNGQVSALSKADRAWIVSRDDIEALFIQLCGYAVYSHIDELRHGFISADRELRVGVSGTAVVENGIFRTVRDITCLTVRIPRECTGCAQQILDAGVRPEHGVLIAGAPSSGKTTLLRDLARIIGSTERTAVLDERFEIEGDGYDLGAYTSVLQGYPKREGFSHALRCMSPRFIICDELEERDMPAINAAFFSGVSMIATVHAGSLQEINNRRICRELLESGAFRFVTLLEGRAAPTKIKCIYEVEGQRETDSFFDDHHLRYRDRLHRIASFKDAYQRTELVL